MTIYSANGHSISIANLDPEMKVILNNADILHADGQSVVSFSRQFSDNPIPERSATTDTIHDVPTMSNKVVSHFLLGAKEETISKCSEIMQQKYSNFKIAGYRNGYFSKDEEAEVIEMINASNADILWVGLGKPKEQEFIHNLRSQIQVPVIISCGGCYNFVTGEYSRAPEWMQKLGIEWLHRAFTQPKKLLWRYLTTNPHAIYCVLKHRYLKKG
jgi:exopolysaccharide biosynthesis WecB/TagA/CpsF family protein